jgi:hypothetical protein
MGGCDSPPSRLEDSDAFDSDEPNSEEERRYNQQRVKN